VDPELKIKIIKRYFQNNNRQLLPFRDKGHDRKVILSVLNIKGTPSYFKE
jgi:hypothetical protein